MRSAKTSILSKKRINQRYMLLGAVAAALILFRNNFLRKVEDCGVIKGNKASVRSLFHVNPYGSAVLEVGSPEIVPNGFLIQIELFRDLCDSPMRQLVFYLA